MKFAAISDIHGDFGSLTRVWQDLRARDLIENPVLNAGDTVAYGLETMRCIDFVRDPAHKMITVAGNYDRTAAKFPEKATKYRRRWAMDRPEKFDAIHQASDDLAEDARAWLLALPTFQIVEIGGVKIGVSHYAQAEGKEGLWAETPQSRLLEIAAELEESISVLITGHTHSAFVRRAGGIVFVNPGSVGRSFGSPTYAEIEIADKSEIAARIISCAASPR